MRQEKQRYMDWEGDGAGGGEGGAGRVWVNLALLIHHLIPYTENPRESTVKLLELS